MQDIGEDRTQSSTAVATPGDYSSLSMSSLNQTVDYDTIHTDPEYFRPAY